MSLEQTCVRSISLENVSGFNTKKGDRHRAQNNAKGDAGPRGTVSQTENYGQHCHHDCSNNRYRNHKHAAAHKTQVNRSQREHGPCTGANRHKAERDITCPEFRAVQSHDLVGKQDHRQHENGTT